MMTKKQREAFNAIGAIFADFKDFFSDVDVSLTPANTSHYEAKFEALMARAESVMKPEKFTEFRDSNTKRWEKKKAAANGQTSHVQAPATQQAIVEVAQPKQAQNGQETPPSTEVQELRQTIENLRVIIAEQQKIIEAERAINRTLQAELAKG